MPKGERNRGRYPGLKPSEVALWRAWLGAHEEEFDRFEYNVHVGRGTRAPIASPGVPDELRRTLERQWVQATQRKIDVVAIKGEETWVIEVEPVAGTTALGQLLAYESLLPESYPVVGQTVLALVCGEVGSDMLPVLEQQGIRVWKVTAS